MAYRIEPMRVADIPAIVEIERQSFSLTWPARAYRRELEENRLAHYLVLREIPTAGQTPLESEAESKLQSLVSGIRHMIGRDEVETIRPTEGTVAAYLGLWMMVDEAHITTIAVRPEYRRRGLGELLMIAAAELALWLQAAVLTLEVRASNVGAQALYQKFGFAVTGVRRHYYSDNNEDALIMTTDTIAGPAFQRRIRQIKAENAQKLGAVEWRLMAERQTVPSEEG